MSGWAPEALRKLIHIGAGGLAFAVRPLGVAGSAALAAAALLFNLFLLPRVGGRLLWRPQEEERGVSAGIALYPFAVLLLVLLFHRRLEVAAAAWGLLAFGDGSAALIGALVRGPRLPWNRGKSWVGSAAFWLSGALAVLVLLQWTAPGRYPLPFAIAVAVATALLGAAIESLPLALDDNLAVPLLSGLFLLCLLETEGHWSVLAGQELGSRLPVALMVNVVLAAGSLAIGGLDRSGAIAGCLLGAIVYIFLGWPGYLLLIAFFLLGTGLTRLGWERKVAAGLAQARAGRRSARHAVANAAVPAAAALFAATTSQPELFSIAYAGALASAAADTAGSEVGQLWGRPALLITTLRRVPRGTQGGVSLVGTLAGLGGALVVAALGAASGLYPWPIAKVVAAAGVVGSLADSVLGATLEDRGLLDNEAVNFLNTLCGALCAAAGWSLTA